MLGAGLVPLLHGGLKGLVPQLMHVLIPRLSTSACSSHPAEGPSTSIPAHNFGQVAASHLGLSFPISKVSGTGLGGP
jgi:hypothetical protein